MYTYRFIPEVRAILVILILQSFYIRMDTNRCTQGLYILCHSVLKERLYFLKALDLLFKDMI